MSTRQKVSFFLGVIVLVASACGGGEKPAATPEAGSAASAEPSMPMDGDAGPMTDGGMDMK